MRRSSSVVAALTLLAFLAGACGVLGGDGRSGGTRSADRPAASLGPEDEPPEGVEFATDFSRHSVPYSKILSGGPPKDGIPAIDDPRFVTIEDADSWRESQEPVILFLVGDDARAYPIQIVMGHEIVNDTVGGVPVVVLWKPGTASALDDDAVAAGRDVGSAAVFSRTLDGATLTLRSEGGRIVDERTGSEWNVLGRA
jgi:hypothetical protein